MKAGVDDQPHGAEFLRLQISQPPERIAGFIFIGTPDAPLEERLRPDLDEVVSPWTPPR